MEKFTETLLSLESDEFSISEMVSILEIICTKIDINTISGMARSENKTPRGIKISNQYKKIEIGCQKMCIKGLKENSLPF